MALIKRASASPAGVVIALDRQERGQGELSAIQEVERDFGMQVASIVTLNDLVAYLEERGDQAEQVAAIRGYREQFGI
jgi:orotate phosphoribosyltransferase